NQRKNRIRMSLPGSQQSFAAIVHFVKHSTPGAKAYPILFRTRRHRKSGFRQGGNQKSVLIFQSPKYQHSIAAGREELIVRNAAQGVDTLPMPPEFTYFCNADAQGLAKIYQFRQSCRFMEDYRRRKPSSGAASFYAS